MKKLVKKLKFLVHQQFQKMKMMNSHYLKIKQFIVLIQNLVVVQIGIHQLVVKILKDVHNLFLDHV